MLVFRSESNRSLLLVELTVSIHLPNVKQVVAGDKLNLPKLFFFGIFVTESFLKFSVGKLSPIYESALVRLVHFMR